MQLKDNQAVLTKRYFQMALLSHYFNIDDFYDKVLNETKFNARRPVVRTLVIIDPYLWNLYEGFKRCF